MKTEYEFRECLDCTHIQDCPEPKVGLEGKPEPPNFCYQRDKVILTQRINEPVE